MEFYRLTVFACNLLLIMMLLLGYANVEGSPRLDVVCLEGLGVGGGKYIVWLQHPQQRPASCKSPVDACGCAHGCCARHVFEEARKRCIF